MRRRCYRLEELGRRNTNLLTTPPAHPPPSPLSTLLLQSSQNVPSEMQRTCPLRLCLLWDKAPLYPSSSFTTVSVSSQTLPSPQAGGPVVPAPPGPCWPAPAPPAGNACLNPVFLPLISAQKLGYPPPPWQTRLPRSRMSSHGLPQLPGDPHASSLSFPVLF